MAAQLQKINQMKFASSILNDKQLEERKKIILQQIKVNIELEQLIQEALQRGDVLINFDESSDITADHVEDKNTISINFQIVNSDQLINAFEAGVCKLTNIKKLETQLNTQSVFDACFAAAPNGYSMLIKHFPSATHYAKKMQQDESITRERANYILSEDGLSHVKKNLLDKYYSKALDIIISDIRELSSTQSDVVDKEAIEKDKAQLQLLQSAFEQVSKQKSTKVDLENIQHKSVTFAFKAASLALAAISVVGCAVTYFSGMSK